MSKLPAVGTTIFSVMSKLAVEHKAINLSQGFPNFPIDATLKKIYQKTIDLDVHQYAPMPGNQKLLFQIAQLIQRQYQRTVNFESQILVTAGATQGIFSVIQALVEHNDEVVVLDPCYDCYDPAIVLAGGKPIHISLTNEYLPDWQKINDAISDKTKMLIINNPHNPSGRIWQEADFQSLESIMESYPKLILLSDEVYEFITFEQKHISVHGRSKIADRTIIVSSFGKTFHITGWKMGYLVAPEKHMIEIKKVHQFLVFSVNSVAQETLARYLEVVDVNQLGSFYQEKRDLFRNLLTKSRFQLLPSEGTYFQVASYAEISDESDIDFTQRLVKEFGVATIPISVFNQSAKDIKHIRFCYAKTDETLIQAAEKLCKI